MNSIKIYTATDPNIFWTNTALSESDYEQLKTDLFKTVDTRSVIVGTLIPIRTNGVKNFLQDFFLPTTINHAVNTTIAVSHFADRFFIGLTAFLLDVFTLPIRLFTAVPRILTNTEKTDHPLYKYLLTQQVNNNTKALTELLKLDHLRVELMGPKIQGADYSETTHNGIVSREYTTIRNTLEIEVNFIELPTYINDNLYKTYKKKV